MQTSYKKIAVLFLFSFFVVANFSNSALAVSNICPGEPVTLQWTSANVAGVCVPYYSIPACTFSVTQNTTNSIVFTTPNSCNVSLTCDDVVVNDSITINPNQSRCCGNWGLSAQTYWDGTSCSSRPDLAISYLLVNGVNTYHEPVGGSEGGGGMNGFIFHKSNLTSIYQNVLGYVQNVTSNLFENQLSKIVTKAYALHITGIPGTPNTLTAGIQNYGTLSTNGSFSYFFQVATNSNGTGAQDILPASSMGTLGTGGSNSGSRSYTFPNGPGTYYIRACADKTSSAGGGVIDEGSNEGNNCGSWELVTVACTGLNSWDTVSGACVYPRVASAVITDQNYPPGDIRLTCSGALQYTVVKDNLPFIATTTYSDPVVLNDVVLVSGTYIMKCINGSVSHQDPVTYNATMGPPDVTLDISLTAVKPPATTTIKWVVDNPRSTCTLSASIVCANNACTAAQLAASTTLNAILSSTNTDLNDPDTSRSIITAITSPAPGHKDSDTPIIIADYKALGKKSIPIRYTTDITLNCNGIKETKRIKVTRNEEQ